MTDYVRARVPRDGTYDISRTTSAIRAAAAGWDVLDEPTHGTDGRIRAVSRLNGRKPKPQTSVAQATKEKAAKSAVSTDTSTDSKEN